MDQKYEKIIGSREYTEISNRTHFIDFNNPYDYRNIILLGDVSSNNKKNKSNLTEQFDLLKTSPTFQNRKKLSKYRFLLMPGTEDTLMIKFRAIKPTYKRTGFYHLKSYSGYIKVLRKHNAIVEISIIAEKDAELLKNNSHKKRSVNAKRNDFDVIKVRTNYAWHKVECIYVAHRSRVESSSEVFLDSKNNNPLKRKIIVELGLLHLQTGSF